ncbi:Uncharacterised protein [Metamycoplasma cloacale]|uniref:Uncharacterized protein n=1 Tax=Metamycoplasma cloacale TaxID=92401 RepID=A0A2Z4LMF7_9BACT|nr:hypothetical protein [Metamycoplasma cloacale]AWX42975.1 hypothetical protein DK849_02800 [Metamycoplasma cloacale]VEU79201.1 Uncharacterised protein [Metamycoplasma cloacale]
MADKKNLTTEKKSRRTKILWGAFWGTVLSGALAAGVTIPVIQAHKKLPKPLPVIESNESIIEITNPDGSITKIPFEEITKLDKTVNENKYIADQIKNHITEYLYNKEYEASLKYEAIYKADKINDFRTIALPSKETLKSEETKKINDLETRYKEQFGFDKKWEEKFLFELAKPEYGNAKSKEEAIEYKVIKRMEANAYRRYELEINQDFTYTELKQGYIVANADVYYTIDGKKVELYKKGDHIPLPFAIENENYVLPSESDPELKVNKPDEFKVPLFVTKSFIFEEKNPKKYINEWIKQQQFISSDLTLSAKPNSSKEKPWVVSKDEIIKLFTYSTYEKDDSHVSIELGIDRLAKFMGLTSLISSDTLTAEQEKQAKNDKIAITNVSSNASNASKYGADGFKNAKSLISSSEPKAAMPIVSILNGDVTQSGSGFYKYDEKATLFSDLRTKLLALFESNAELKEMLAKTEPIEIETNGDYTYKYSEINEKIKKFINELEAKDFDKIAGEAFRDAFAFNSSETNEFDKYKYATVIKVDKNFVIVSDSGINIKNVYKLDSLEVSNRLIKRDLAIQSKANISDGFNQPLFDLPNMFKEILTENYKVNDLLHKDDFIAYLKTKQYTQYQKDVKVAFSDEDVQKAIKYYDILQQAALGQELRDKAKKIREYIDSEIEKNFNADFIYKPDTKQFVIRGHEDQKLDTYFFEQLKKFIEKKEKGE